MTQVGLDNKIDKVLKVPEIIVTSSTNTLALKGLEVSSSAQNQVVTIDPLTGVLNRSSFLSRRKMLLIIEQLKGSFVYNAQSHYHT
jgi:GGDEF domain-containing protein